MIFKYYGGVDNIKNYGVDTFIDCIKCAIKKENELPQLITMLAKQINIKGFANENKKPMRDVSEIAKTYGIDLKDVGL